MFANCFKGKKVLVTGNSGFKGAWLSIWLNELGADVYGISKGITSSPSMFEALQLNKMVKYRELDIRDLSPLRSAIHEIKPDFVFHLAAQALVFDAYEDPVGTMTTNVIGTAHVLESLRDADWNCTTISITSDKCYENVEWLWGYRENDALGGSDPYSASKACAEHVIHTYYKSYFSKPDSTITIASTRAGNVIGGGDWSANRVVPDCVRAWSQDKPVELRRPQSTRPWQHVLEPLSGYLRLAQCLSTDRSLNGEAFNFGPNANQNHSVLELIESLKKNWFGKEPEFKPIIISPDNSRPEAGLLKLSCDKALAKLAWQPTLEFEDTSAFTAGWYEHFYRTQGDSMLEFTKNQIQRYTDAARKKNAAWTV